MNGMGNNKENPTCCFECTHFKAVGMFIFECDINHIRTYTDIILFNCPLGFKFEE